MAFSPTARFGREKTENLSSVSILATVWGIKMLQAAGIPVAILTGRISAQTAARAKELGITCVKQGKRFKTNAGEEILAEHGVSAEQTAYMGDDVPDIPILQRAGLAAVPGRRLRRHHAVGSVGEPKDRRQRRRA